MWSIGVILYELCTHKKPFLSLKTLANNVPYKPIDENAYSNDLRNLIDNLLTIDPNSRYTVN